MNMSGNGNGQQSRTTRDRTYISRDEFEVFERNIERSFDNISTSFETLSRKIDNINNKGTDWKALISAAALVVTIMIAIGSIIAWGMNQRMDSHQDSLATLSAFAVSHEKEVSTINAAQSIGIEYMSIDQDDIEKAILDVNKKLANLTTQQAVIFRLVNDTAQDANYNTLEITKIKAKEVE